MHLAAESMGKQTAFISSEEDTASDVFTSDWVLVTSRPGLPGERAHQIGPLRTYIASAHQNVDRRLQQSLADRALGPVPFINSCCFLTRYLLLAHKNTCCFAHRILWGGAPKRLTTVRHKNKLAAGDTTRHQRGREESRPCRHERESALWAVSSDTNHGRRSRLTTD